MRPLTRNDLAYHTGTGHTGVIAFGGLGKFVARTLGQSRNIKTLLMLQEVYGL